MIRIELNARRSRMRTAALSGFAVVLVLAALQVIDRRYPLGRIWRQVLDPAVGEEVAAPSRRAAADDGGLADPEARTDRAAQATDADASPRRLGDAPGSDVVDPPPERGVGDALVADTPSREMGVEAGEQTETLDPSEVGPRQSRVASEALRLCARLPRGTSMSSLACQSGGEFTLEGLAPSGSTADLFSFLDTLKGLPSDVSLSYWREGRSEADPLLTFTFEGRLLHPAGNRLLPVGVERAESLLGQIESRAHALGLAAVAVEPPSVLVLGPGLARHRQKCWATGTHRDLVAFAASLTEPESLISVGEIVVVPTRSQQSAGGGRTGDRLRLYAAVDVLVADEAVAPTDR